MSLARIVIYIFDWLALIFTYTRTHKHIITIKLSIISNIKLRNLISKGPKYREPVKIDFEDARSNIEDGLTSSIESIAANRKVDQHSFSQWKDKILELVDIRIVNIRKTFVEREVQQILNDQCVKDDLKSLHSKFVFVPIDKASNNIAIICKRLYASVIYKELNFANLGESNDGNTYKKVNGLSPEEVINRHKEYQQNLNIKLEKDMEKLPRMYWTPKMHKKEIGARFIVASMFCRLKPLAKDITSIFQCIYSHVRACNVVARFYS